MNFIWSRTGSAPEATANPGENGCSCVRCPMCSCEIPLVGAPHLPSEFSAACPNCGHRNVYLKAAARDVNPAAAAIKATRKIQFGKKIALQS